MEEVKTNSGQNLGIAALITGIITFVLAVIPCVGIIAIIPGIIAISPTQGITARTNVIIAVMSAAIPRFCPLLFCSSSIIFDYLLLFIPGQDVNHILL